MGLFSNLGRKFPLDLEKKKGLSLKTLKDGMENFENTTQVKDLAQVYSAYEPELLRRGRYDYEDMILFVLKELRADRDFWQNTRSFFSVHHGR